MAHVGSLVCRSLPRPGTVPLKFQEGLRVLLMSSAINNLTRRIGYELEKHKVECMVAQTENGEQMEAAVRDSSPDLVVCPYLITKIPKQIFCQKTRPGLIVHPGVAGERGVSSLDFAIRNNMPSWGVTVLQAEEEYDSGAVWSTDEFPMPDDITKTALYNGIVSDVAVRCTLDAVSRFSQGYMPEPFTENTGFTSSLLHRMRRVDRYIDWRMPAETIATLVRMSDTRPGAIADLHINNTSTTFRLFNAHVDDGSGSPVIKDLLSSSAPGMLLAERHGFVLVRAGDGQGVWIGQMKKETKAPSLKLPAMILLREYADLYPLPCIASPCGCDDITLRKDGPVCYIHFPFYNGAMSTQQARRLREAIDYVKNLEDVQLVALMGGDLFFSTGINLSTIENSSNKQDEAWSNINGIDDVIQSVVTMTDKASVAVLKGNAAAGGAMFAAACDLVVSHPGVLLTPSYKAMSLYGSEYWTYFLPRRVGQAIAEKLVEDTTPMSAEKARSVGLLDHIIGTDILSFNEELPDFLKKLLVDGKVDDIIRDKRRSRDGDWLGLIQKHRDNELEKMAVNFRSEDFLTAMNKFLYRNNFKTKL